MPRSATTQAPVGRRERNKQEKLDRILAAAGALFAERGVEEVTTQEIARAADIGTGTLFLYARSKGELLLMVQNARYQEALERGRAQALTHDARQTQHSAVPAAGGGLAAVMAVVTPVVECNRAHVDNGRTYLREMVFGAPGDPQREVALGIVAQTEVAVGEVLLAAGHGDQRALRLARVVSAVLYLAMAGAQPEVSTGQVLEEVRELVATVLDSTA